MSFTRRNNTNSGYNSAMNTRSTRGGGGGGQQNFVSGGQFIQGPKPVAYIPLRQPNQTPRPQQQQQQQQQQVRPQQQQQQPLPQMQQQQQQVRPLMQQLQQPPRAQQPTQQAQMPQTPVLPPAPLKSALKKPTPIVQQTPPPAQPQLQPPPQQQQQQQPQATPVISTPQQIKPKVEPPSTPLPVPAPISELDTSMSDTDENGEKKKKIFFKVAGKISKKERRGRRNQRLRKILQPKNALMVLNELLGGQKFSVIEKDPKVMNDQFYTEPDTFIASVSVEGLDHYGYGKTKAGAKTAAAEMALKHVITTKLSAINNKPKSESFTEEDVAMKIDGITSSEEDAATTAAQQEEDVSWLHIASFAMHKLFSSWDSEGLFGEQEVMTPINNPPVAKRPAKALPANPHLMNPVMLLNQMRPGITYEDVAREGNSPNTTFTIKTTLDGQEFYGKGSNKKLARKNCAYAACSKLFELTYSAEDYQPIEMMVY